uniref:Uncharacterized protein n=1 Tax=Avena sativa TaxID=4498 RepID=A0ACD5UN65_AVESA
MKRNAMSLRFPEKKKNEAAGGSADQVVVPGGSTNGFIGGGFGPSEKRKRSLMGEEEVVAITYMTEAMKAVAAAITTTSPPDVHPSLYDTVMSTTGFSPEALMVALSHLFDNRAQGNDFVHMAEDHMELWLRTFLTKHYYV